MRRLLGLLAVVLLAGCGGSSGDADSSPSTSSSLSSTTIAPENAWASPAHYRFDYRPSCLCPSLPTRVEVRNGKVVSEKLLDEVASIPGETDAPTIEELLAEVKRAETEATGEVKVDYDENGVPVEAHIDWVVNAADDESIWRIENFTVLP